MCRVEIPNKEITFVYSKEILSKVVPIQSQSTAVKIQQAIFERDFKKLQSAIEEFIVQTISHLDGSNEGFYHGLMLGLCSAVNNAYRLKSNREAGFGRFDIELLPLFPDLPGFIIELKATREKSVDLEKLADEALEQIKDKQYSLEMQEAGVKEIHCIGIAFRGKEVCIKSE